MDDAGVAAYIAGWVPVSVSPEGAVFAREAVAAVGPASRNRAGNLLWAAGRLADFGLGLGLEPVPEVLLHPSVVERFIRSAGLPDTTRETLRGHLRFLGPRVVPGLYPAGDVRLPRGRAKQPYTAAEIGGFLALADAQPTRAARMRVSGLVCLGAGAGLVRGDLRGTRGTSVRRRPDGAVVVDAGPARPRTVPVLERYQGRLLEAAAFAGDALLVCGGPDRAPARRSITGPLVSSLAGGGGLPRLDTSRLRATWLAECAGLLGLATFMRAAGISCSQRLGDLVAALDPGSEDDAVRLLGAARRR